MNPARAILVGAVILLNATQVYASEKSKLLYSRGLVELHAGQQSKALELFEQAVTNDPEDIYARYYRGVTRGRLGDPEGAVSDLQQVVAAKPELTEATLDLGIALVEAGRYPEAITWLERAMEIADLKTQASLFLGIAQVRVHDREAARANLAYAANHDPAVAHTAHYYMGIADFEEGYLDRAERNFRLVTSSYPNSQVGREAAIFLDRIDAERANTYELVGSVAFQYDSNVILAPAEAIFSEIAKETVGVSQQGDGRFALNAGGSYVFGLAPGTLLTVGYDFYQSLHFQLNEFNLQDHRPSLMLDTRAGDFRIGLLGRYDYFLLETASFLSEGNVLPFVTMNESDIGHTELSFRYRYRDFLGQPLGLPFGLLSGPNYAPAINQLIYLCGSDDCFLSVGYQFDRQDSDSSVFSYNGNQISVGIGWQLPWLISAEANYAFRQEVYDEPSKDRQDGRHDVIVFAQRPVFDHVNATVGYFGTFNKSNQKPFEYNRDIVSVGLEVRL